MTTLVIDLETAPDRALWSPPVPNVPDFIPIGTSTKEPFAPTYAHRIIVIGYLVLDDNYKLVELDAYRIGANTPQQGLFTAGHRDQDAEERDMLRAFSDRVSAAASKRPLTICTFNGRRFDLPVLVMRALKHVVPLPWMFRDGAFLTRYKERPHLDVADAIALFGASRDHTSLDNLARLIGLPGKVGVDGSVGEMYERGEIDRIANYCLADVAQTALLMLRWKAVQFELPPQSYIAAEGALRLALMNDPRLADLFGAMGHAAGSEVA